MDFLDDDERDRWNEAFDTEDEYLLPGVTDSDIRGIADGYDDMRINMLVQAYTELRSMWNC